MNASDSSGLFSAERGLAYFSMLRLQYVLLVFYETHKKTKGRIENPAYLSFSLRLCLSEFANVSSQF